MSRYKGVSRMSAINDFTAIGISLSDLASTGEYSDF